MKTNTTSRNRALKRMLEQGKRAALASLRQDMREASEAAALRSGDVFDAGETVEAMCADDLRFALLPMKAALLTHIEDALGRLEEGRYGRCRDCRRRIPEMRLTAMPFAVRCTACEEKREESGRLEKRKELPEAYLS